MLKRCRWRTVLAAMAITAGGLLALSAAALASSRQAGVVSAHAATRHALNDHARNGHVTTAHALSGSTIQIGTTAAKVIPAVVVDPSGDAYLAWDTATSTGESIDDCMIAPGQTSCSSVQSVSAPGNPSLGNISLTLDDGDVVMEAEQFGDGTDQDDDYVNEWTTPDGTDTFAAVSNGESVAQSDGGYDPDDIFALPGTTDLGFGYGEVGDNNYFLSVISPFNAPPECSELTCTGTPQATLNLQNSNIVSQAQADFVTENGTTPGVLGVMNTANASGCPSGSAGDGISYIYGSGNQSSTNSYGISPGTTGSAWQGGGALREIDCNSSAVTADSGPDGLGILESNEQSKQLQYRVFDQATQAMSAPINVTAPGTGADSAPYLDQDSRGGLYAEAYNGNSVYAGPQELSYSSDDGLIWRGPVELTDTTTTPEVNPDASVGSSGQGWLVWEQANHNGTVDNYNIDVQQFDSADVPADPTTLTTVQTTSAGVSANATITAGTTGESDRAVLTGDDAASATGSVKYELLAGSCDPGLTLATYQEGSSTITTAGTIPPSSPVTTVLQPGTYYWEAIYSGDANNAQSSSACGSEVLTVTPPTTIAATVIDTGTKLGLDVSCASGAGCVGDISITGTYSGPSANAAKAATTAKVAKTTLKKITLASGRFDFKTKGVHTISLRLTTAAKKFLKSRHAKLTTLATIVEYISGHRIVISKTVTLKK